MCEGTERSEEIDDDSDNMDEEAPRSSGGYGVKEPSKLEKATKGLSLFNQIKNFITDLINRFK